MATTAPAGNAPDRASAVPYRVENGQVELLVVRTRDRRGWTFPKGTPEPADGSLAGTALREACEEAGVHGVIDERPLAAYRYPQARGADRLVAPYLLRVLSVSAPRGRECDREPTWVTPEGARGRLAEAREGVHAAEHDRVVTDALARIRETAAAA